MLLHELKKSPGRTSKWKRLGRWNRNGKWKYCGKWLKGQNSRSGGGVPNWFEWGQTPLYRRLPKLRWFKRHSGLLKLHEPVNLGQIEEDTRISSGDTLTKAKLVEYGYIRKPSSYVKVLARWKITKKVTFDGIDAISAVALKNLEAAWWSFPVSESESVSEEA